MTPAESVKGKILEDIVKAAKERRKDFDKVFDEVRSYCAKGASSDQYFNALGMESELWFKATIAKTAQAIDLMGPYLYPANPQRTGTVRLNKFESPDITQLKTARNQLMTDYLNFTPSKTDLKGNSILAINQTLMSGLGCMWTGLNERSGLVCSVHDDTKNVYLDPDANSWREAKLLIREWEKPRWELREMYPKSASLIESLPCIKGAKASGGRDAELVRYQQIYMLVGLHRYAHGKLEEGVDKDGMPVKNDDNPRVYCVSDNGVLIHEGTWEIPFFYDREWPWPMSPLTFIDDDECIYPISPLRAGLGHQRALNWLYIFYMTKLRFASRSMLAVNDPRGELSEDDLAAIFELDNDMPVMKLKGFDPAAKINDIVQQLNFNPNMEQFKIAHEIINREYQEHTGLYDVLHYGSGPTQDRSAAATQLRDTSSKTRLNYRKDRVADWQSKLARREALAARFIHNPEQISVILGPEAGQLWGQIMAPQQQQQGLMSKIMGMFSGGQQPQNGVVFEEWINETDYMIESGSMRRKDVDQKREALQEVVTTTAVQQIKSLDPSEKAVGYLALAEYYEAIGVSNEVVEATKALATQYQQQAAAMAQMQQQQMAMQAAGVPPPGQEPPESQEPQEQGGNGLQEVIRANHEDTANLVKLIATQQQQLGPTIAKAIQEMPMPQIQIPMPGQQKRGYKSEVVRDANGLITHILATPT